jgi:calcineurin-like phosphoesterase family protein|tara:strand:+ start:1986 stop:2504 length:519 start_codon:yes stop_codon:yes gene_type:complete
MKIFATGNQQFGRKGAINKFNRPFSDVREMNDTMVDIWNSVVSDDDLVFVLGNFAWDPVTSDEVVGQLNGTIQLICGEFDEATESISDLHEYKLNMYEGDIHTDDKHELILSYWPLKEWRHKKKGYQSVISFNGAKYKSNHKENLINVNCDYWSFKPVELKKIKDLFTAIEE